MRSLKPSEQQIQASIVEWLRRVIDCRVCHIPNGGSRDKREAARLKWQGVEAGAPDLMVIFADGPEPRVLFIEVKTPEGQLRKEQKAWRDDCKRYGHDYLVARSLDEVMEWFGGEQ